MEASSDRSQPSGRQPIELEPGDALDVLQSAVNVLQRAGFRVVCFDGWDEGKQYGAVIIDGVAFIDGNFVPVEAKS